MTTGTGKLEPAVRYEKKRNTKMTTAFPEAFGVSLKGREFDAQFSPAAESRHSCILAHAGGAA